MLFRKIFDFIFASPVTVVFSVVSVACVSILVVKITSNMAPLSDVEGITSGTNTNGVSFQQNDSSSDKTSYDDQVNDTHGDDLNSGFQSRSYSPSQVGNNTNKNKFNTGSEFIDSDDYSYSERVDSDSSVETVNQTASTLNFSTGNAPNSVSTTSGSTTTTTEPDEVTDTISTEQEFPGSLEYEVKIDFEETQTISCQPVVANGSPCMCTFTRTDADGSISQLVDNCG